MKIMFFNLNYGRNGLSGVLDFIEENKNADIYCFQEIKESLKDGIDGILTRFNSRFISKELGDFGSFNLATYVSKKYDKFNFEVLEENLLNTTPAVFLEIISGNSKYSILNFHGRPKPGDKLDSTERLETSKRLIKFMEEKEGIKIVGGDFNLLPHTQSILDFENSGYKNLIKEFNILTTRNNNAWKLYDNKQLFADYVFISKNTQVKNFEVITNEISDHLPIVLEIENL